MKKDYSTRDIRLAAAFLLLGAKLADVDRTDRRHQVFTFQSPTDGISVKENETLTVSREIDLEEIARQWTNGELVGRLDKYAECFQRMKATVHSG